ncbi:MAG: bifunctional precorrin-2 dehydrogenase/sirohydrochlorin ferrochelatase [Polyangiaceae bacterium]
MEGRVAPELYPLFLRLEDREVLVVGAGVVAERKVDELLLAGAIVRVVAPSVTPTLGQLVSLGRVHWDPREFKAGDTKGAWLVVAATGDHEVNAKVAAEAHAHRIFVNAVDDPPNASAFFAAVVKRPPFAIAISSNGELPGVSRLLREILEAALPEASFIARARELRRRWKADKTPHASRFAELVRAAFDADGARRS